MAAKQLDDEAIFKIACRISSADVRADYLRQACGDDQLLRERVAMLLQLHDQDKGFLERPAGGIAGTIDLPPAAERLGTQIGPYKLIQEIGEGGMGIVYMAAQKEPVRRKVALKIIKPGMDTRAVVARFEAEQQALAMMDHPNIAKVHDAGTTDWGRPYFVMELVNGVPLTEYCDDNHLATRDRLELFILLCLAVQHAHQKGIIHRDLKPSNILVTLHDGVPVPKIIDFGIAKAINQQLTDHTVYTGHGQMIGTPLYMSPEQAATSGLDIDTRSDIYSLGVLLYELLTGSTPFSRDEFQQAGFDEVRRLIREQEPPRPSTRVSTLGKAASTVSEHRKTNPVELSNSLRHELDWIVMKALEKDRTRRYETANDFARDIQRYLDDDPVEACPPSRVYRVTKFLRRNRTWVLAAAAVMVALMAGLALATGQALRATRAEVVADAQARLALEAAASERSQRTRADENFRIALKTVDDYLTKVSESKLLKKSGMQPLRNELLELALAYYEDFTHQRGDDANLQSELAAAYYRVGNIRYTLGSLEEANTALEKSLAIRLALAQNSPEDSTIRYELAHSYQRRALVQMRRGKPEDASLCFEKGLDIAAHLESMDADHVKQRRLLVSLYNNQGALHEQTKKMEQALASFQKSSAVAAQLVTNNPDNPEYADSLGLSYTNQGVILLATKRAADALDMMTKSIHILRDATDLHPQEADLKDHLANAYMNSSRVQQDMGNSDAALQDLHSAREIEQALVNGNPDVFQYQTALANILAMLANAASRRGDSSEAIEYAQQVVHIQRLLVNKNHDAKHSITSTYVGQASILAGSCYNLAKRLFDAARFREASLSYEEAIRIWQKLSETAHETSFHQRWQAAAYCNLGLCQRNLGQLEAAKKSYETSIALNENLPATGSDQSERDRNLANGHGALAYLLYRTGPLKAAIDHNARACEIITGALEREPTDAPTRNSLSHLQQAKSLLLVAQGDFSAAEATALQALAISEALATADGESPEYQSQVALSCLCAGEVYAQSNRLGDAEDAFQRTYTVLNELTDAQKASPRHQEYFARSLDQLALLHLRKGTYRAAQELLVQALEMLTQLTTSHPDVPQYRDLMARSYWHLGSVQQVLSESAAAAESFGKAVDLWDNLVRECSDDSWYAVSSAWLLATCPVSERCDIARAVELTARAVTSMPDAPDVWRTAGVARYHAGQLNEALEALRKSAAARDDAVSCFFLAMALWKTGAEQEAGPWYEKAAKLTNESDCGSPELHRFWCEAAKLMNRQEPEALTPKESITK